MQQPISLGVWISLTIAVIAIAWVIEGKPGDEKRERLIRRIERYAIFAAVICAASALIAGLELYAMGYFDRIH